MPRQPAPEPGRRRPSPWTLLVTGCAVLVVGSGLALATWWLRDPRARRRDVLRARLGERDHARPRLRRRGDRRRRRARRGCEVRRTDEYAFGRRAVAERRARRRHAGDPLALPAHRAGRVRGQLPADGPRQRVGDGAHDLRTPCASRATAARRRSTRGTGDIAVDAYCGFALRARAQSGDVSAGASCAPERLELRSRTGDVRAVVPPGRYQVDADTDEGTRRVRGVDAAEDAPFLIQALLRARATSTWRRADERHDRCGCAGAWSTPPRGSRRSSRRCCSASPGVARDRRARRSASCSASSGSASRSCSARWPRARRSPRRTAARPTGC